MDDEFIEACLAEDRETYGKFDTGVPCRIPSCKGTVIEHARLKELAEVTNLVLGPSARTHRNRVLEFFCSVCGISYHHLPELAKKHERIVDHN